MKDTYRNVVADYCECHYCECHHAECRYAECHYAECLGAPKEDVFNKNTLAYYSKLQKKVFKRLFL